MPLRLSSLENSAAPAPLSFRGGWKGGRDCAMYLPFLPSASALPPFKARQVHGIRADGKSHGAVGMSDMPLFTGV